MDSDTFEKLFSTVRVLGPTSTRQRGFVAFRDAAVQYDSSLEYAFLKRVADDPNALAIVSQPCRVPWLDMRQRSRSYVPDYAVLLQSSAGQREAWIVELKIGRVARRFNANDRRKYRAMQAWAGERGASFTIVTNEEIDNQVDRRSFFWAGHLSSLYRTSRSSESSNPLIQNGKGTRKSAPAARKILRFSSKNHHANLNSSSVKSDWNSSEDIKSLDTVRLLRNSAERWKDLMFAAENKAAQGDQNRE